MRKTIVMHALLNPVAYFEYVRTHAGFGEATGMSGPPTTRLLHYSRMLHAYSSEAVWADPFIVHMALHTFALHLRLIVFDAGATVPNEHSIVLDEVMPP